MYGIKHRQNTDTTDTKKKRGEFFVPSRLSLNALSLSPQQKSAVFKCAFVLTHNSCLLRVERERRERKEKKKLLRVSL